MSSETPLPTPGSRCVLDTNVLLYAEQGRSQQARQILQLCRDSEIYITLPSVVWHELIHKLMLAEALARGTVVGPNAARRLAESSDAVRSLSLYRTKIQALLASGVAFEPVTRDDTFARAFDLQKRYGLLTNDSLLLACAIRISADYLVTADKAFQRVTEILVIMLRDLA